MKPPCATCDGTGEVDSGGFTPWDSPISLPCPTCSPIQLDAAKHNEALDKLIEAEAARPMGLNEDGE